MAELLPLAMVEEKFPLDDTILEWHTKKVPEVVLEAGVNSEEETSAEEDQEWVKSRVDKWRKFRRDKALLKATTLERRALWAKWGNATRYRASLKPKAPNRDASRTSAPVIRPLITEHPDTGLGWLSDEKAAAIRFIGAETLLSEGATPYTLALCRTLFSGEVPTKDDLFSKRVIGRAYERLFCRDILDMQEKLQAILDAHPEARVYVASDDTHYDKKEAHVVHISYFDSEAREPRWIFMSIAGGTDKTNAVNAGLDLKQYKALKVPLEVFGGFTADHAALGEGDVLGEKIEVELSAPKGSKFFVKIGDGPHKHMLNAKHRMEAASGTSAGLGDNHWKQMLHTLRWMYTGECDQMVQLATSWVEGDGPHQNIPPDPNTGRWAAVPRAGEHFFKLKEVKKKSTGEPFLPNFFHYVADMPLPPLVKSNSSLIATMCTDPRNITFIMFEVEYFKKVHQPALETTYQQTRQGWSGQFGIFDVYEHNKYLERPLWENLVADPAGVLPKTYAEAKKISSFKSFAGDGASAEASSTAAVAHENDMYGCLRRGIAAGHKEFLKNCEFLHVVPHIVLALFSRSDAGPAIRVFAKILQARGHFLRPAGHGDGEPWFLPPDMDSSKEIFFMEKVEGNEDDLEKTFVLWSLFDRGICNDLIKISHNAATTREDDTLIDDFVHGRDLEDLFEHCCHAIAPHATSCLIVELSFSQQKAVKKANQTDTTNDQLMWYLQNIVHFLRRDRMGLIKHFKDKKGNHGTIEQIIMGCQQLLEEVMPRYSQERMQFMPSRASFNGNKRKAAKEVAKACVKRLVDKRGESQRPPPTESYWT